MLQQNHCVLSLEYYKTALNHIQDIDQIFIFTDDFPWCKNTFEGSAIYVDEDKFTQLYMMTKMKHLILANSTFSWWGAYLNNNEGKIIIPDPWFGPNYKNMDVDGLYYPKWIKHKHEIVLI